MPAFETIGVIAKINDEAAAETVERLATHLARAGRRVLMDADTVPDSVAGSHGRMPAAELVTAIDLLIAVGGDGTMLTAARAVAHHPVPVLGVNRGRLGFLVDVSPSHLDEIDAVLEGDFVADDRIALTAEIRLGEAVLSRGLALNDVVMYRWNTSRMVEFDTFIDGELCNRHRSDGIVVSTPTGLRHGQRRAHHASGSGGHRAGPHLPPHPQQPPAGGECRQRGGDPRPQWLGQPHPGKLRQPA